MEKNLLKKENLDKSNEKSMDKREILVKKRINILNRLSMAKSPTVQQTKIIKSKKNEKIEQILKKSKIQLKNSKNTNSNNNEFGIKDKNILLKKNNDDKKKLLGQIITDFSTNKMMNNNIFDDGNPLTFNSNDNNNYFNNTINSNINTNINANTNIKNEKEKETLEINNKTKKNTIEEIPINNFNFNKKSNNNNNNLKTMKLSISSSRGNYYKRRPFYIIGKKNIDKNDKIKDNIKKEEESSIKKNFPIKIKSSFTKSITPSISNYNLNSNKLLENIIKRNKQNLKSPNMTYNDNMIENQNNQKGEENNDQINNKGNTEKKINNINNINNNISLNNKYNFYIKIGKNNKLDSAKENNDINYEIKLTSPSKKEKEAISPISSRFIKKLIVECDIDKLNKNLNLDDNKKGINVNIKPLYKKIEIEKILVSNDNDNEEEDKTKNKNDINSPHTGCQTSRSYNKKSFKFLIHQAYNNRDISTSFNKYYNSGKTIKERSLSIQNNKKNNDSFNNSNKENETVVNDRSKSPLGLTYIKGEQNNINDTDTKIKKIKSFYKSFRNIGRIKKQNNVSIEENENKNDVENDKENNLTFLAKNTDKKTKNDNLELTPVSISVSNMNEENIYNKNINNDENNQYTNIPNSTKRIENKIHRIVYSKNGVESTPKAKLIHSKINTSFSTDNSNFNSISSTLNNNNNNNNIDSNYKNISSISSSISTNLSISFINLEILYVLEEKLKIIIEKIKNYQRCSKECYEFINYYFTHNFYNEQLRLFKPGQNRKIINNYIKYELLCYFLCYDISFTEDFKQAEIILKSIFSLIHKNFLIFLVLVISNYKNKDNNIIIILNKIVKDNLYNDDLDEENNDYNNLDENKYVEIIDNNSKKLIDYYKMIIENIYMKYLRGKNKYIKFPDCLNFINTNSLNKDKLDVLIANFFIQANKSLSEYNYDLIKKFFYSFLYSKQSSNKNINFKEKVKNEFLSPKIIKINNIFSSKNNQFLLPKIKKHKYTLVLDLDETLIYTQSNFYYNNNINIMNNSKINMSKNSVILRPGLHEFLHDMKLLFELIIFSSGTPDYVDPILKVIEKEEKYFDYILYRQHITTDENGDNVKNLNLIGRDLKNVIIIDDVSKYFKLHKENGICIKPFCGNILSDRKTLKALNSILQKIRFDADESKDIRISLDKYRHLLYPIENHANE